MQQRALHVVTDTRPGTRTPEVNVKCYDMPELGITGSCYFFVTNLPQCTALEVQGLGCEVCGGDRQMIDWRGFNILLLVTQANEKMQYLGYQCRINASPPPIPLLMSSSETFVYLFGKHNLYKAICILQFSRKFMSMLIINMHGESQAGINIFFIRLRKTSYCHQRVLY